MATDHQDVACVFTYGTLKRGQCRENCWPCEPARVVEGWVRGNLFGRSDYPALAPGRNRVGGEIWEFRQDQIEEVLSVLDRIEGTAGNSPGDLYHRHIVEAYDLEGSVRQAHVYYYNREPVADGFEPVEMESGGVQAWP